MQQQYAQQAMAMRQMYAMQVENQMLRNQMLQIQKNNLAAKQGADQVAMVRLPFNANGDSNVLLATKKKSSTDAKKKLRTVSKREKQKATDKADADKLAMNDLK